MSHEFNFSEAFERNIGWLTEAEQQKLRTSCVAVAGLGGAGGYQLQALARLGVSRFKIADPDSFELINFNHQIGATIQTIGKKKADVTRDMLLSINPESKIDLYPEEVSAANVDDFLTGADVAIDGIDFFEQNAKLLFFKKCREKKIPAITACPLGFGASVIVFSTDGMKYEDYFDITDEMDEKIKRLYVTFGLSPSPLCLSYMDRKALELEGRRAASVSPGLLQVGAMAATEVVKILTNKGTVLYCPHIYQVDFLTQQARKKYFPMGMRSLFQRMKRWLLLKLMNHQLYYLLRPGKKKFKIEFKLFD